MKLFLFQLFYIGSILKWETLEKLTSKYNYIIELIHKDSKNQKDIYIVHYDSRTNRFYVKNNNKQMTLQSLAIFDKYILTDIQLNKYGL